MSATTPSVKSASAQTGRGETVLVVEDDSRVRRVTVASLADLGYRVIEAGEGTSAMEMLGNHPEIEILFSDLVMPGEMSGLDLAKRVRELYPRMHIILTSGYSAELLNGEKNDLGLQILRKPYRHAELARAFREALRQSKQHDGSQ